LIQELSNSVLKVDAIVGTGALLTLFSATTVLSRVELGVATSDREVVTEVPTSLYVLNNSEGEWLVQEQLGWPGFAGRIRWSGESPALVEGKPDLFQVRATVLRVVSEGGWRHGVLRRYKPRYEYPLLELLLHESRFSTWPDAWLGLPVVEKEAFSGQLVVGRDYSATAVCSRLDSGGADVERLGARWTIVGMDGALAKDAPIVWDNEGLLPGEPSVDEKVQVKFTVVRREMAAAYVGVLTPESQVGARVRLHRWVLHLLEVNGTPE
jgi:hypothetical protein